MANEHWIYRRDSRVTLPLEQLGLRSADGLPILRPEVRHPGHPWLSRLHQP